MLAVVSSRHNNGIDEGGVQDLIACHECDLLQRRVSLPEKGAAKCPRCGTTLYKHKPDSLDRTLALTIGALILFVVANSFPFLTFGFQGQGTQTTLFGGAHRLYEQGDELVAGLVLLTTILAPLLHLSAMLYLLVPLHFRRRPLYLPAMFRLYFSIKPWVMLEVFMLGILVSIIKLVGLAEVVLGLGFWAFFGLIFVLAWASAAFDPEAMWRRVEEIS
jgi:paraquat-inducible protein A